MEGELRKNGHRRELIKGWVRLSGIPIVRRSFASLRMKQLLMYNAIMYEHPLRFLDILHCSTNALGALPLEKRE